MPQPGSYRPSVTSLAKERLGYIRENSKIIARFLLALLFLAIGAWFFRHEQPELGQIKKVLLDSKQQYIILGISITIIYIILQGIMYRMAFASVKKKVPLGLTIILYLKRNLISIFMPAGGITSLAFFSEDIEQEGSSRTKIYFASSIYAFTGILSTVIVAVPVFIYAVSNDMQQIGAILGLAAMILTLAAVFLNYRSVINKRIVYKLIVKYFPSTEVIIEELISHAIEIRFLIFTLLVSIIIDLTGILHLYIAMMALGFEANIFYALLGYLTAVVILFISPFMRGLGAVEISLSYILIRFGYTNVEAVAITFLYRFFEFWLPLLAGALSFFLKINKLLMRIVPAILIFSLGIVNIISAITPAIADRVRLLEDLIPISAMAVSNFTVFIAGAFLLLTAVYLLRGLRNAWMIAVILGIISFIGHLTKAIDYEEATLALLVVAGLVISRKQYYVRANPRLYSVGIWSGVFSVMVVLIYGTIGFYFLDKRQFGIDFDLTQSIGYTIKYFFLIGSSDLNPVSHFAKYFLVSINISGFLSITFLLYTLLKPYFHLAEKDIEEEAKAEELKRKYGKSALDYFKTYRDKIIFCPNDLNAFLSYKVAGSFAVVLENPVADNRQTMMKCVSLFDRYCFDNGLKSLYYRIPEEDLPAYSELSKKTLFIGQEAVIDLNDFTISGVKNKALRNAINKVTESGYHSSVHLPPIKDGLLQKMKAVSDSWLESTNRREIVFSQGMFVWEELKNQTIITVENQEEKVAAFLNIIPDFKKGEATYDLIRKTPDTPHGILDYIMVELFNYLKSQGYNSVNLGFAPMSGIDDPHTFQERSMRFAYEKIKTFSHYRGLRNYKEKFFPVWYNKYLVYADSYDLLQVPSVLMKIIKPDDE
jgi:phosphatidylglycerol lysyltransferase